MRFIFFRMELFWFTRQTVSFLLIINSRNIFSRLKFEASFTKNEYFHRLVVNNL